MRVELTGRQVDITPVLRRLVDRKLARLERILNDSAVSAQVVLTREKRARRADVTLHARGEKFLHGVGDSASWDQSLSQAIDKIAQQAQRIKGKWQERKRRGPSKSARAAEAGGETGRAEGAGRRARAARLTPRVPRVLRASRQPLKPLSVADAARQADTAREGVVVFRNVESGVVSVLVRRSGGDLVLVETE